MIKIVTGFKNEQKYSIEDDEAHKAYYLFLNPEKRGVFSNGLALIGKHIQSIEPDYQGSMGWNPTHELDSDDWNEIRGCGADRRLRQVLSDAKRIAYMAQSNFSLLEKPLDEAMEDIKLIENANSNL